MNRRSFLTMLAAVPLAGCTIYPEHHPKPAPPCINGEEPTKEKPCTDASITLDVVPKLTLRDGWYLADIDSGGCVQNHGVLTEKNVLSAIATLAEAGNDTRRLLLVCGPEYEGAALQMLHRRDWQRVTRRS